MQAAYTIKLEHQQLKDSVHYIFVWHPNTYQVSFTQLPIFIPVSSKVSHGPELLCGRVVENFCD
jgi:hypothetical protein